MRTADALSAVFLVGAVLLIVGAVLALLPSQAAPPPEWRNCVTVPSSDGRGLPPCDDSAFSGWGTVKS